MSEKLCPMHKCKMEKLARLVDNDGDDYYCEQCGMSMHERAIDLIDAAITRAVEEEREKHLGPKPNPDIVAPKFETVYQGYAPSGSIVDCWRRVVEKFKNLEDEILQMMEHAARGETSKAVSLIRMKAREIRERRKEGKSI